MCDRLILHNDGWCFGTKFFIQAALFELTKYADWHIEFLAGGPCDNMTNGQTDTYYYAWRAVVQESVEARRQYQTTHVAMIPAFRINANSYSYQTVFASALSAVQPAKDIDIAEHLCFSNRAIRRVLAEHYL